MILFIKKQLRNLIRFTWVSYLYNRMVLFVKKVDYTTMPTINGKIWITNGGSIQLGANIVINNGQYYNTIGGDFRTYISVAKTGSLVIGNNVGISNAAIVCHNSIIIEDNVLIGGSSKIYDTDFHSIDSIERTESFLHNTLKAKSSPIIIKKGAWIGGHCIILKGVTIGENSVIGAGSVVTKNIPSNQIWGGNPATFKRQISS